jgi:hypothetical protein
MFLPSVAGACDFPLLPSPALYQQAGAVFVGRVVQSPWESRRGSVAVTGQSQVVFAVQKTFKGAVPREVTLTSEPSSCTYTFLRNETYLIHAGWMDGKLEVHQGMRPLPIGNATEALKYVEGAMLGRPPAVLKVHTDLAPRPTPLTLVLQASNDKIERSFAPGDGEIMLPPGEYNAWLQADGKQVSERKTVRLQPGQYTNTVLPARR